MHRLFIVSILAVVVIPARLAGAVALRLDQVADRVLSHNPEIIAARLGIEEAHGRLLGSGRLANPEAAFEFNHDTDFREGTVGLSFDQRFPLTARLRLEKKLSAQLVAAAELEVRDMERKLVAEAQALAVRLLSLEQQRALRKRQTDLALQLSGFAADRAAAGELSPLDAAQAQVDAQRLLLEGRKLETERVALLGELKPLVGVGARNNLTFTGALPKISPVPGPKDWEQRADYQLARLKEEAATTGLELAKSRKWDDITAGLMVEGENEDDSVQGLESKLFLGFRISIPLPLWNKNEGEIVEKTAGARRARLETEALGARIANEEQAALNEMKANAELAAETRDKLLPLVIEQTEKLEKAYESGQTDLFTVLRAREQRLQLESAVLDATRDWHLARIRHEAATRAAPRTSAAAGGK